MTNNFLITFLNLGFIFIIYFYLSIRIILFRGKEKIAVGDGGNKKLLYLKSAQSNLLEYSIFFLLFMFIGEYNNLNIYELIISSIIFLFGRLIHFYAFTFDKDGLLRKLGMGLTFTGLFLIFLFNILYFIGKNF